MAKQRNLVERLDAAAVDALQNAKKTQDQREREWWNGRASAFMDTQLILDGQEVME